MSFFLICTVMIDRDAEYFMSSFQATFIFYLENSSLALTLHPRNFPLKQKETITENQSPSKYKEQVSMG